MPFTKFVQFFSLHRLTFKLNGSTSKRNISGYFRIGSNSLFIFTYFPISNSSWVSHTSSPFAESLAIVILRYAVVSHCCDLVDISLRVFTLHIDSTAYNRLMWMMCWTKRKVSFQPDADKKVELKSKKPQHWCVAPHRLSNVTISNNINTI